MTNKLDRGARALAKSEYGEENFDGLDEGLQEQLREHVRAVLEATDAPDDDDEDMMPIPVYRLSAPASEQGLGETPQDKAHQQWRDSAARLPAGNTPQEERLVRAFDRIKDRPEFLPNERVHWLEFRSAYENWPGRPR